MHAFEKSFSTGCYFAFCGAWRCALCSSIQILLITWLAWLSNLGGLATDTMKRLDFSYIEGLEILSAFALFYGAVFGFIGSILWFFIAGFYQQTKVGFDQRNNFRRTLKSALWGMIICGWSAALTGTFGCLIVEGIWPNLAKNGQCFGLLVYGLFGGNLLGCIVGVFAPGFSERVIHTMQRFVCVKWMSKSQQ